MIHAALCVALVGVLPGVIDLTGPWDRRTTDESDTWEEDVTVPEEGKGLPNARIDYKRTVDIGDRDVEGWAIAVGEQRGAFEILVDGVRVGGQGSIERKEIGLSHVGVHPVPPELLRDGHAEIVVRTWTLDVIARHESPARLARGPFLLGPTEAVVLQAERFTMRHVETRRVVFLASAGLLLLLALYHALMWHWRREHTTYLWYTAGVTGLGVWCVYQGISGYDVPVYIADRGWRAAHHLCVIPMLEFTCRLLRWMPVPKWIRAWQIAYAALAVALVIPGPFGTTLAHNTVRNAFVGVVMAALVVAIVRSILRGEVLARWLAGGLALSAAPIVLQMWMQQQRAEMPLIPPALFAIFIFVASIALALAHDFVRTQDELDATHVSVRRFVPFPFLQLLGKETVRQVERGDSTEARMTVLFADIRGFTSRSEQHSPAENFAFLNEYFGAVESCIHRHDGFIEKFYGDGLLALFPGSADQAVAAAREMLDAVAAFNRDREETLRIGIGVHTGRVMAGTIGGHERLDSGVIGDAVNLTSRIESLTKDYGHDLLVSGATRDAMENGSALRRIDETHVKGREQPVTLYGFD